MLGLCSWSVGNVKRVPRKGGREGGSTLYVGLFIRWVECECYYYRLHPKLHHSTNASTSCGFSQMWWQPIQRRWQVNSKLFLQSRHMYWSWNRCNRYTHRHRHRYRYTQIHRQTRLTAITLVLRAEGLIIASLPARHVIWSQQLSLRISLHDRSVNNYYSSTNNYKGFNIILQLTYVFPKGFCALQTKLVQIAL